MTVQYDLTYLAVVDKHADEAVAVTTLCLEAYFRLEHRVLDYEQYDFVELKKAEYDTYISMEVVPYKSIFRFLTKA